jgi:hypothetical protein
MAGKRTQRITTKFDDEEERFIREAASRAGMTVSEFIRAQATGSTNPVPPSVAVQREHGASPEAEGASLEVHHVDDLPEDRLRQLEHGALER